MFVFVWASVYLFLRSHMTARLPAAFAHRFCSVKRKQKLTPLGVCREECVRVSVGVLVCVWVWFTVLREGGTTRRVRLPVLFDMPLTATKSYPPWDLEGKGVCECVGVRVWVGVYCMVPRDGGTPRRVGLPVVFGMLSAKTKYHPPTLSRETGVGAVFKSELLSDGAGKREIRRRLGGGAPQPMNGLTRGDVAVYANDTESKCMRWQPVDTVEKGDQEQIGTVRVRTPNEVRGSRSSVRVDGDAVALMLELTSCFPGVSDHATLSSCRCGKSTGVVG